MNKAQRKQRSDHVIRCSNWACRLTQLDPAHALQNGWGFVQSPFDDDGFAIRLRFAQCPTT